MQICPVFTGPVTYYLYDAPLSTTDHCKYLGVTLQSNLKFDIHVQEIYSNQSKPYPRLIIIRRNVKTTSVQLKERAYKALVRPQLEYVCTVWSPWQGYPINTIEKVQCRAARYIHSNYCLDTSVLALIEFLGTSST